MEILKSKLATSLKIYSGGCHYFFRHYSGGPTKRFGAGESHLHFQTKAEWPRANHQSETRSSSENAKGEYSVVKAGEIVCGHRNYLPPLCRKLLLHSKRPNKYLLRPLKRLMTLNHKSNLNPPLNRGAPPLQTKVKEPVSGRSFESGERTPSRTANSRKL